MRNLNYGYLNHVPAKDRRAPVLNKIRPHNASRYFLALSWLSGMGDKLPLLMYYFVKLTEYYTVTSSH